MKRLLAYVLIMGLSAATLIACGSEPEAVEDEPVITDEVEDLPKIQEPVGEDTTAPVVEWTSDVLFTNSLNAKAAAGILSYTDDSDCTVELSRFTKLSNLETLDADKIQSYTDSLNKNTQDELLAMPSNKAAGEGIYRAVVSVEDAYGNVSAHEILVVYDKTAPEIGGIANRTVVQANASSEPQVDLSGLTITDNVDGEMDASSLSAQLELKDEAKRVYEMHVSVKDRCGNEAIDHFSITVESEQPEANTTTASSEQNTTTSNNSTNNNNKQATQQAAQPVQQKTVQYQTTTTFNMAEGTLFNENMAQAVLPIINQRRADAGLPALTWNNDLTTVAKVRSLEIVSNFEHKRPDGREFSSALDDQHLSYGVAGENLACGQTSADAVMTEWMNSQTHKDNILRKDYKKVGIACYYDPTTTYQYYWVEVFSD